MWRRLVGRDVLDELEGLAEKVREKGLTYSIIQRGFVGNKLKSLFSGITTRLSTDNVAPNLVSSVDVNL